MMTKEEVVEIMTYCREHGVSYKARLSELNIPAWRFHDSKAHYAAEQVAAQTPRGEFVELPHSGTFVPVPTFGGKSGRRPRGVVRPAAEPTTIEIRMTAGTAIRIQGGLSEKELCAIIKACGNVQP